MKSKQFLCVRQRKCAVEDVQKEVQMREGNMIENRKEVKEEEKNAA